VAAVAPVGPVRRFLNHHWVVEQLHETIVVTGGQVLVGLGPAAQCSKIFAASTVGASLSARLQLPLCKAVQFIASSVATCTCGPYVNTAGMVCALAAAVPISNRQHLFAPTCRMR
jgi:hypothetical protein